MAPPILEPQPVRALDPGALDPGALDPGALDRDAFGHGAFGHSVSGRLPVRRLIGWAGVGLVVAAAAALVLADRRELPAAWAVLRSADPRWVAGAAASAVLWYVAYGLVHREAQRAAGLEPAPAAELAPVTLAAHGLNQVTKSAAMAGLVAFDRLGRRRGQAPGRVLAAYLLAGLLGEMAFVAVLGVGLVLVAVDGQLTVAEIAAGAVFGVYLAVRLAVLSTAFGDRARARRLVGAPYRWWARIRRRSLLDVAAAAEARADELHEAVALLRRRPAAVLPAAAAALGVEAAGVALLWTVLAAVGAPHSLATAVVGYAVSVLFSIVGFLPGGLGFVEVSLGAVLVSAGSGAASAAAAVVLYRLFELWLPVGLGMVAARWAAGGPGRPRSSRRWPRSSRRWRWAGATAVVTVGVTDLALAATVSRPVRLGFLGLDAGLSLVVGARYLLVVSGLAALLVSSAVRRGKRNAWWLALAATVASVPGHHLDEADAVGLAVSVAAAAVLVAGRAAFTARSDPALARRGVQTLLVGGVATFAYGTLGLYALDSQFRAATTLAQSAREALRLLFLLPLTTVEPATRHGRWFLESVRFAALGVAMVGAAQLVATLVRRPGHRPDERARVDELLDRWATTSLAPFQLLDDKSWYLTDDGQAFVGYKVVGTTAVALGGPIGRPAARPRALAGWMAFCQGNGWLPVLHQVTADDVALGSAAGLRALKIGEEAVVDLTTWDLADHRHKHLRQALRRVERTGARVEALPTPLDDDTLAELRAVSDAWLHHGGHRERTFTLGRFDPVSLRHTPVLALRDTAASGRILAFVNVLPSYQGRDGNFDLMRRRPDAPNGAMEALFVALIDRFRAEGLTGMNLGLAPLSGIDGTGLAERALRLLYERGGAAFNYEGLRHYKEKWEPRWEPRYVLYRSETDLPRVATAIARAGELPDPRSPLTRVAAVARRFPVTTAVTALVTWLMAATAFDPRLHGQLLRQYGISWGDLTRLQLWRLPTSQLLQTRPGWVGTNLLLLVAFLPLAEWRLGSARTAAVLAVADWSSTLSVLAGLRLAAALGDAGAAHLIAARDAGTSSALYAAAAATAASLPRGRARLAAGGGLALWLGTQLVVHHRLFDVQHAAAALAAVAVWLWWRRRDGARAAAGEAAGAATSSNPSPTPAW
ncbi:MAG: flippase-like domain-containing protein [Acidimicrobiales bacterium]